MNYKSLIVEGYKIQNAKITGIDLSMEDHGCLTLNMALDGEGWCCVYGGYCLGKGYLDADSFEGSAKGLEYIMRIMDTVGVSRFQDMTGKYIRVATIGYGSDIRIIGNIIKDKWFDPRTFFEKTKHEQVLACKDANGE